MPAWVMDGLTHWIKVSLCCRNRKTPPRELGVSQPVQWWCYKVQFGANWITRVQGNIHYIGQCHQCNGWTILELIQEGTSTGCVTVCNQTRQDMGNRHNLEWKPTFSQGNITATGWSGVTFCIYVPIISGNGGVALSDVFRRNDSDAFGGMIGILSWNGAHYWKQEVGRAACLILVNGRG